MFKIKNFKVELKHLLTALSAIGMLTGFILSLVSRKKTAPITIFVASFAAFLVGAGMETGLVPQPEMKKLEISVDDEEPEEACEEACEEGCDVIDEETAEEE